MSTVTDYLEIADVGTGLLHAKSGYYIQLRSQTGGGTYTSSLVTDSTGFYSIANVPPDSYEIWYSTSLSGPWTDSRQAQYVPVSRPYFDVISYAGADPTGVTDAAPAINTTLTAAAGIAPVFVPPGSYKLNTTILIPSNTVLLMDRQAIFTKTSTGVGISNAATTVGGAGNSNITIIGGVVQVLGTAGGSNHLQMIQVTNLRIEHMVISGAQSATGPSFWMQNVYKAQIRGIRLDVSGNTLGQSNGIWLVSGDHVTISDCIAKSDDDAFAIGTGTGASTSSTDIHDVTITNCVGESTAGRILDIESGTVLNISRVVASNITGYGVQAGVFVGAFSTGTVTDVELSNITVNGSLGAYGLVLDNTARVYVTGFVSRGSSQYAVLLQDTLSHIYLDHCELTTVGANYPVIGMTGTPTVTDLVVTNSHLSFASPALYGFYFWAGTFTDVLIDGNQIEGTASAGGGIYLATTVTGLRVTNNRFKNLGWVWLETGSSDFNLYANNDVRTNTAVWQTAPTSTHSKTRNNQGYNETSALQTLVGSDTIVTSGINVARVTCTAARSGVILAVGNSDGQEVTVVNEGGFSVTFAASGTSHVADGVSDIIVTLTARKFVWDVGTSLWYRAG